ncbi:MAG TPA: Ig-like domain-containing protein, partial [Allosphingosinicella sp.]|nr:Ig-like domain-containing protein [Allosphingosinicella sp.]
MPITINTVEGDNLVNAAEDGDVDFKGTWQGSDDWINWSLDGPGWDKSGTYSISQNDNSGSWDFDLDMSSAPEGTYTLTVDLVGDNGSNNGPQSVTFTVDRTPPSITTTIQSVTDDVGAIKGVVSDGGVTDDTSLLISGKTGSSAGTAVNVYDGSDLLGTATTGANGAWTFNASGLSDGNYDFRAGVSDLAGNVNYSGTYEVEVDTNLPNGTITIEDWGTDTGADDGVTTDTTITLTGDVDVPGFGSEQRTVGIFDNGVLLGTVNSSSNSGGWSFTTTARPLGNHVFQAYILDPDTGAKADGSNTVEVEIVGANTPPVGVADTFTVAEDGDLTVTAANGVLKNDTDAEGGLLTVSLVGGPANGSLTLNADGSFTYVPDANYNGTDSFTYKPNDASADGDTVTVNLTVNPVNDAPVAVDDSNYVIEDGVAATGNVLTTTAHGGAPD